MFCTMKYNKQADALTNVQNLHNTQRIPCAVSSNRHLACQACRAGKFRCSGQESGCDRCREKNINCFYTVKSKATSQAKSSSSEKNSSKSSGSTSNGNELEKPSHLNASSAMSSKESSTNGSDEFQDDRLAAMSDSSTCTRELSLNESRDMFEAEIMDWNASSTPLTLDNDLHDAIADIFASETSISPLIEHFPRNNFPQPQFNMGSTPSFSAEEQALNLVRPSHERDESIRPDHPVSSLSNSRSTSRTNFSANIADLPLQRQPVYADGLSDLGAGFSPAANPPTLLRSPHASNPLESSSRSTNTQPPNTMFSSVPASFANRTYTSPYDSETPPTASSRQCACILIATKVLEAVSTDLDSAGKIAPDDLLNFHKSKLRECEIVLECAACRNSSTVILLLALVAEKLIVSSHRLPGCIRQWQSIQLGSYLMDSPEECQSIIKQLVVRQLKSLHSLIKTLLYLTYSDGCEMHQNKIRALYDRFKKSCLGMDVYEP